MTLSYINSRTINHDVIYSCTKELTDAIKFLVGISMSMTTLNIFIATGNILNRYHGVVIDNLLCILAMFVFLLSIAGINSLVIFSITSGIANLECSDYDVEFGIKIAVYGVIWVAFIEALLIFLGIMNFLYCAIIDAKLHELCESCFDICKNTEKGESRLNRQFQSIIRIAYPYRLVCSKKKKKRKRKRNLK